MMMKTTHFRPGDHPAGFRWFDSAGIWAIHLECKMGAKAMIVGRYTLRALA
jgi:hypothetical protein